MPGLPVVFFILAAVAIGSAIGMLVSRSAIYSALFLVLNFVTVAVLYLILGAPFIALSQITVYAGSIMVLFLFVIMLLGAEHLPKSDNLRWQPLVAFPLGLVLVAAFVLGLFNRLGFGAAADVPDTYGAPSLIGEMLFTDYTLPFLVTGVILLVAVIGAIFLAKSDRPSPGQVVRRYSADVPAPAGAASAEAREVPAAEQEAALKQETV
jgi:NADH-quinone oxidoreductase subunit J